MAGIVARLRSDPPATLGGLRVTEVVDLAAGTAALPPTDGLVLRLVGGARVVLRPSGTEPKLKAYLEVATEPVPTRRRRRATPRRDGPGPDRERRRRPLSVDQGVFAEGALSRR